MTFHDIQVANASFSHKSSHHGMVTKLPYHICDNSWAITTWLHSLSHTGALGQASGKPVAETIRLFLDQPGTPLVDVRLSCDQNKDKPASLQLKQRRYRPAGSEAPAGQPWTVPVCVRYSDI